MDNELQTMEEQHVEVMQVNNAETLMALTKGEIDAQIATAKQYPRNLSRVLNNIETLATMDEDVAGSCFYTLRRKERDGSVKLIEGASVRMAEIVASSWGNLRTQARIIANDGKTITAQGVCHDLETNTAISVEVKRRITDKSGKTYNEDMQIMTGNAACAIALRNAVFKVVPAALIKKTIDKAKKVSLGESMTLETSRANMLAYFKTIGVDEKQIFDYLSVEKVDEIDTDMVVELRGLATAIKEGTTTVKEAFEPKVDEKKAQAVADKFADFGEVNDKPKDKKGDKK